MGDNMLFMDLNDIAEYAHGVGPRGSIIFEKNFMAQAKERDL